MNISKYHLLQFCICRHIHQIITISIFIQIRIIQKGISATCLPIIKQADCCCKMFCIFLTVRYRTDHTVTDIKHRPCQFWIHITVICCIIFPTGIGLWRISVIQWFCLPICISDHCIQTEVKWFFQFCRNIKSITFACVFQQHDLSEMIVLLFINRTVITSVVQSLAFPLIINIFV